MCRTTKAVFEKTDVTPAQVTGISFCSQMQGMVLVDEYGRALRRPMSYMDQRASAEFKACQTHGPCVSGVNIGMLLRSLRATHAASTSVKDPLWKYKWVQAHEPEIFQKSHKWLDVKESLIARATGEFVMTRDSAYSTFLYDTRPGHEGWNEGLCRMYGVETRHLAKIIECTDVAGLLTEQAARELGLCPGTRVYGGGGDATLIGVGAGCTAVGSTHIYSGTSGWVGTVMNHQAVDLSAMIAGIVGAEKGKYNYFAEMETAGKCFEWVKDHLVLDEVNIYLSKTDVAESQESVYESLYDYMSDTVARVAPGSGGVIFTPWLHGNRCPFEDPAAAGMFFNIRLETGKAQMLLPPALDARMRGTENKDGPGHPVRRRRGAFKGDVSDAGRHYRPDSRDSRKHEGRRGYRRGDAGGGRKRAVSGSGAGCFAREGQRALHAEHGLKAGLRPQLPRVPAAARVE